MKQLAPDVWQLDGRPADMINVYVVGDVLIDAGTRYDAGRILRQLRGPSITAHALTHGHPGHMGSSHAVCEKLGVPFWAGAQDADAASSESALVGSLRPAGLDRLPFSADPLVKLFVRAHAGPVHPVARRLNEGDQVSCGTSTSRKGVPACPSQSRRPTGTPRSTVSRHAGWPRSNPDSSASATGRHSATRGCSWTTRRASQRRERQGHP